MKDSTKETLITFALVVAVGFMCGFFGFMGGMEKGKNESRETATVIVEVDTLLLDRWQIEYMPIQIWGIVGEPGFQLRVEYKIKAYKKKDIDTARVMEEYALLVTTWWNPEKKKWMDNDSVWVQKSCLEQDTSGQWIYRGTIRIGSGSIYKAWMPAEGCKDTIWIELKYDCGREVEIEKRADTDK